jgi:Dolichyl-phosphate-mannose-protein mannosyltransferase
MRATLPREAPPTEPVPAARDGRVSRWPWPLLLVLVVAAVPRLWSIGAQPVLYFDSGVYLGEGAFLASAAQHVAAALAAGASVAAAVQDGTDGHPPDIAKPGHAILLGVSMLVLGKTVLAGALVSALAGIGTVAAAYALGRVGWNRRVAFLAALLLAVSGQHVVYSREPLVEADGLFFATLGALVYLRAASWRGLVGAGALYGIAFTCNNRLSYLPLVFAIVELGCWSGCRRRSAQSGTDSALVTGVGPHPHPPLPGQGEGARGSGSKPLPDLGIAALLTRGTALAGGFLLPPALIQVAYLAARGVGRAAGARMDWLDYVQQLATFSRMNPPDRVRFDEWPTYFVNVALMDGPLVLALVVLGVMVLLARRRWSRADLLLGGSLLVPLLLYSVYSTGEVRMRHFSLAVPWVMLAAALGLDRLLRLVPVQRRVWATAAAALVLLVLAAPRTVDLASAPSGMPAVLAYIDQRGLRDVATTNGPVLAYFVGEGHTNARLREAFVNTPADLGALAARYDILIVDMQAHVFPGELTQRYDRARPEFSVPNGNATWYLADLLEHYGVAWGGWDRLLADWAAHRAAASELRVYAMRDL